MTDDDKTPTEQLVELLVYAPVGLVYDYQKVLDQLVVRGKSQVQLAKLMSQMAAKKGQVEVERNVGEAVGLAAQTIARGITELGVAIGLAPTADVDATNDDEPGGETAGDDTGTGEPDSVVQDRPDGVETPPKKRSGVTGQAEAPNVPIDGYDDLTAKEINGLLGDLDAGQRQRVRDHETANRGRKTILANLDRLDL
jgi:hypothetical protein